MSCWLRLSHLTVRPAQFVSVTVPWSARSFCQEIRSPACRNLDWSPVIVFFHLPRGSGELARDRARSYWGINALFSPLGALSVQRPWANRLRSSFIVGGFHGY